MSFTISLEHKLYFYCFMVMFWFPHPWFHVIDKARSNFPIKNFLNFLINGGTT